MNRILLILALMCSLPACSYRFAKDWPQSIPPQQEFQDAFRQDRGNQLYQSEREYLDWILVFYQGSLFYPTGWRDIESAVLANTPPQQQEQRASRLQEIGREIAAEWARHNAIRLIDNRLLQMWGSMLQLAPDSEQQARFITLISCDIDAVLERHLDAREINAARYEKILGIQLFEDF